ncbi:MAG TPA: SRPBCC domain-containing protein [Ktedonobacteraceae bacterium]|jgi:uncharacterized protein YndB with AHSA1/START domain
MIPPTSDPNSALVLRRMFTAPRGRVFRAWIEPEALEAWLRPKGMSMTVRRLEACVGGSFCFDLENGSSIVGIYLDITPPEKLVFTWSGAATQDRETIVTLNFFDQGPVTEVVLTHERIGSPELRALFGSGWPSMFDALASVLSSLLDF